jgi:hypothetical protein
MLRYQHIPIRDVGRLRAHAHVPCTGGAGSALLGPAQRTVASGTTSVAAVLDGTSGAAMPWQRLKQPA